MSIFSSGIAQIKKEIAHIETSERKIRSFAFLVGGVLILLGLFFAYRHHVGRGEIVVGIGAALVVFGIICPIMLTAPYRMWMGLAVILGVVVGNALLTVFYFAVITPIGLLRRFFRRTKKGEGESCWTPASSFTKESLEHPF